MSEIEAGVTIGLIATSTRLYRADSGDEATVLLEEVDATAMAAGANVAAVYLSGGEIVVVGKTGDSRRLPSGLGETVDSIAILDEEPLQLLLGTNDARLYRFQESGGPPRPVGSFDRLDCRSRWYTPWGGPPAVRSMAISGSWVYADIHVGSVMRSPDLGETWEPVTPELHEDVHQVATSPLQPDRVYANTANGVHVSDNRGDSWAHRSSGLPHRYGRAIAVHPASPDTLLASVSRGPHNQVDAQLWRTEDAGLTWTHVTDGFPPAIVENIDTFHLDFDSSGTAWAAIGNSLRSSRDAGRSWQISHQFDEPIRLIAYS